ncbi:CotG/ExsB N-terminal domain-containing protein [Bacillus sp. 2205SS5-2]|uniref:CotG/ExsB N-terminal domain-containing protein n=1 Tax=Bacillus sp. 2205SS5-2 TaxID=3109031 RepID=UPI003003BC84
MSKYREDDIREAVDEMKEGGFHSFLYGEPRGNRRSERRSRKSGQSKRSRSGVSRTERSKKSRRGFFGSDRSKRSWSDILGFGGRKRTSGGGLGTGRSKRSKSGLLGTGRSKRSRSGLLGTGRSKRSRSRGFETGRSRSSGRSHRSDFRSWKRTSGKRRSCGCGKKRSIGRISPSMNANRKRPVRKDNAKRYWDDGNMWKYRTKI